MGILILAGSTGIYKKETIVDKKELDNYSFTVTKDTDSMSPVLPIKFKDAAEGCIVLMRNVTFENRIVEKQRCVMCNVEHDADKLTTKYAPQYEFLCGKCSDEDHDLFET